MLDIYLMRKGGKLGKKQLINQIVSLRKDVRKNTSSYMEANKIFSYSLQKQMADLTLTLQNGFTVPDHFKLKVDYKKGVK